MTAKKMSPQEIRAAAAQAAAGVVGPGGSAEDVIKTAEVLGGYISRGSDLVPPEDDAWKDPTAQAIAEMAMKSTRRVEVEVLQRMADEMYRLQVTVRLGDGYGSLEECLRHYWKSLPA